MGKPIVDRIPSLVGPLAAVNGVVGMTAPNGGAVVLATVAVLAIAIAISYSIFPLRSHPAPSAVRAGIDDHLVGSPLTMDRRVAAACRTESA